MIRNLVDFALNNRYVVLAVGVLLLIWGAVSFHNMPVEVYPDKVLKGTISNVGSILDPNIRTAKVRIEVANPGEMMRPGMFATATLLGKEKQTYTAVPASAIVHLHDRDWVFIPAQEKFKRIQVVSGEQLPNTMQEILSGLQPGQQVVTNAINLQNALDNE